MTGLLSPSTGAFLPIRGGIVVDVAHGVACREARTLDGRDVMLTLEQARAAESIVHRREVDSVPEVW